MSNETKTETPKGVVVSADNLMNVVLDRTISDRDQTIGAHKQTIKHLETQNAELQKQLDVEKSKATVIADDQKVVVVSDTRVGTKACPSCGYANGNNNTCYDCGYTLKNIKTGPRVIEYRNLDKVIEDIRKEESKALKVDNVELEKELDNATFKLKRASNALTKLHIESGQLLTDAKREVRERYQKEMDEQRRKFSAQIDENENKIDELVEEIQKLEENKTDAEVEEARKQEIIDLKNQVAELETAIKEAQDAATPRMRKVWQNIADRNTQRKLEEEKESKQDRIDQISNSYPKATAQGKPWWKKGKYAKNTANAVMDANEARNSTNWFNIW